VVKKKMPEYRLFLKIEVARILACCHGTEDFEMGRESLTPGNGLSSDMTMNGTRLDYLLIEAR